jgi:hypothetical protein
MMLLEVGAEISLAARNQDAEPITIGQSHPG